MSLLDWMWGLGGSRGGDFFVFFCASNGGTWVGGVVDGEKKGGANVNVNANG